VGQSDTFRVAMLPVNWSATGQTALSPSGAHFGEAIVLEEYGVQADSEAVQVTLRWSADAYLDTDYTVFVHLVAAGGNGQALAQGDAQPMGGRWPASLWLPGVALDDLHTVLLPPDLAPGSYHLLVGLYDPITGQRLLRPDGSDAVRLDVVIGD